jgi:hypothetical protein
MKKALALLTTTLVLVAGLVTVAPGAHAFPNGSFFVTCDFAKYGGFDPLTRMRSHEHTFIGNKTIKMNSTFSSLRAGSTNCSTKADKSGYWLPTFRKNGNRLRPRAVNVYYVRANDDVRAFPKGMIVKSTFVRYACSNDASGKWRPYDCGRGTAQFNITFFKNSHRYPEVHLMVKYGVHSLVGAKMSSDHMGMRRHGDFFPAWRMTVLKNLIGRCLNTGRTCGRVN